MNRLFFHIYICYQDLSEARYSGHVEHYESVTETRSFSKAPPPPERSVSQQRSQYHHEPHQRESSLSSRSRELSMEKESRSDKEWHHDLHPYLTLQMGVQRPGHLGEQGLGLRGQVE